MHRHPARMVEAHLQELLLVWITLHDALKGSLRGGGGGGGAEDSDIGAFSTGWHGMCVQRSLA